ncbi:hypothetical protein V6N13_140765 [Hibiscus sabdariffa]
MDDRIASGTYQSLSLSFNPVVEDILSANVFLNILTFRGRCDHSAMRAAASTQQVRYYGGTGEPQSQLKKATFILSRITIYKPDYIFLKTKKM